MSYSKIIMSLFLITSIAQFNSMNGAQMPQSKKVTQKADNRAKDRKFYNNVRNAAFATILIAIGADYFVIKTCERVCDPNQSVVPAGKNAHPYCDCSKNYTTPRYYGGL